MKGSLAVFTLIIASLILLPTVLCINTVSAQTSGYTIQSVDHTVEVMFSGHIVIRDVIKVSGSVANGFQIGVPSKYGSSVIKAVAYDADRSYPVEVNVQLGNQGGFYAVQVNFEGQNPHTFTVEFLLSNSLVGEDMGFNQLDYPAYPSLTTAAGTCKVTLSLPAEPTTITISKSDGQVDATTYSRTNLPAYTNIAGMAAFGIEAGLLQLSTFTSLERQVSVSPSGVVTCSDVYRLRNDGVGVITFFILSLPSAATDIVAKGDSGRILTSVNLGVAGTTILLNVTLSAYLPAAQSTMFTAQYNLPSITTGNNDFTVFPAFNYYVNDAKFVFTPPEGAKIDASGSSASITSVNSQQTLTVSRQDVSYLEYSVPGLHTIQINYEYNPLWSSYLPTFWAFGISAVVCVGIIFWRKRPVEQEIRKPKIERTFPVETQPAQKRSEAPKGTLRTTPELVHKFVNYYEDRQEISNEINALDLKAQKGKLPRRQYKIQRRVLETRYETLTRSINESKEVFKNSATYSDLIRQLDSTEADFNEADSEVKKLQAQHRTGEITIEEYKENIDDYQRQREKAENAVNGILLRLREKTR